ncbi:MAG: DUF3098 domain-containing protein [Bacteroidota bacterium]
MAKRSRGSKARKSKPQASQQETPARSRRAGRRATRQAGTRKARMAFSRQNYLLLGLGLALVVAGYAIMLMDNATSDDPVNSPLSLYLAPLLLLGGYVEIVYAILWRPRTEPQAEAAT